MPLLMLSSKDFPSNCDFKNVKLLVVRRYIITIITKTLLGATP